MSSTCTDSDICLVSTADTHRTEQKISIDTQIMCAVSALHAAQSNRYLTIDKRPVTIGVILA